MVETELTFTVDPKKLTEHTKQKVGEALQEGAMRIVRVAKHLVPVDTGVLRGSIHHEVRDWDEVLVGTWGSKDVSYAAAVEFGSVPHTPPFEPIARWAKRHGIPKAAWAIWQKIREHGTQPQPYMRPAIHMLKDKIAKLIKQAMQAAVKETSKR